MVCVLHKTSAAVSLTGKAQNIGMPYSSSQEAEFTGPNLCHLVAQ